jgi:hypothetical protein
VSHPLRALILVTNPAVNATSDFLEIADWISELDPEVTVRVLPDVAGADAASELPDIPTVTVSPAPLRRLRPRRGPVFQGQHVSKSTEYRALQAAGLPVPRWTRLLPHRAPELDGFGQYVVTKPDFGAQGADVRIERRDTVQWTPPRTARTLNFGGPFNPRLVQEFVYTGPWPRSHRVVTLFGSALWADRTEASHDLPPLQDRSAFHGQSVVSSGRGCTFTLDDDPEVVALGERAHAAFPRVPLLGVDIVRDADTGKLYVLEANSLGFTWHFSTPKGLAFQKQFGFDLNAQFDGRRKAASVLVRVCAERAR